MMDARFSLFLLGLFGLLAAFTWGTADTGPCSLPIAAAAVAGDQATTCAEFWFNRYQTLLSALLAFATAALAAALLWKQLRANQMQADAAVGNINPEFSVDWAFCMGASEGELDDAVLRIQNYNRRPISLRRIELLRPPAAILLQEMEAVRGVSSDIPAEWLANNAFAINRWISGRDPAGGAAMDIIRIVMGDEGDMTRTGIEEEVTLRIEYRLHGGTVDLRQVDVTGLVRRR